MPVFWVIHSDKRLSLAKIYILRAKKNRVLYIAHYLCLYLGYSLDRLCVNEAVLYWNLPNAGYCLLPNCQHAEPRRDLLLPANTSVSYTCNIHYLPCR